MPLKRWRKAQLEEAPLEEVTRVSSADGGTASEGLVHVRGYRRLGTTFPATPGPPPPPPSAPRTEAAAPANYSRRLPVKRAAG